MLRCFKLGLSVEALDEFEVGMIYDLLIEEQNDNVNYPIKATQSDFDNF